MQATRDLPVEPIVDVETATAFVLGLIFNQNVKAERAWSAPHMLRERLGTLIPRQMLNVSQQGFLAAFKQPSFLHPFADRMARSIWLTCTLLVEAYDGDPRMIWEPARPTSMILHRLQAFPGIGEHKAIVGVYVLKHVLDVPIVDDDTQLNIRATCPNLFSIVGVEE